MALRRFADDCRFCGGQMTRLLEWFVNEERYLHSTKLFRITIFSWLFLHTALLLPYVDQIWSPAAYIYNLPFDPNVTTEWFLRILLHPEFAPYYRWMVAGQLITLALGIIGYRVRLMTVLAFYFTYNLDSKAWVILDGGNNLVHLLLFYMIFMNTTGKPIELRKYPVYRGLLVAASNASIILCMLQVIALYTTAGILKLQGALWQKGMTLYYLLQSITYSHPKVSELITAHPYIAMLSTYFTMAFQLLFPILIWFKATKHWVMLAGVSLHLGISFAMGLFTFGLVMLSAYPIFFYDRWSRKVLDWLIPSTSVCFAAGQPGKMSRYFAYAVTWLDWLGLVDRAAEVPDGCSNRSAISAWPKHDNTQVVHGYDAIVLVVGRLPLFVPLIPLLKFISYLGLADFFRSSERGDKDLDQQFESRQPELV